MHETCWIVSNVCVKTIGKIKIAYISGILHHTTNNHFNDKNTVF